jgi:hypothetical protein
MQQEPLGIKMVEVSMLAGQPGHSLLTLARTQTNAQTVTRTTVWRQRVTMVLQNKFISSDRSLWRPKRVFEVGSPGLHQREARPELGMPKGAHSSA